MKIYLGIDIGSEEHALHFLDHEGREVQDKLKIPNDEEGFSRAAEEIGKLDQNYQDLLLKVGIESTGDYWRNLFTFLNSLDLSGKIEITMINPNRIHQFKKSDLIKTKTDSVDAKSIARYMRAFKPEPTPMTDGKLLGLRKLCRFARSRIKECAKLKDQLDKLLSSVFPEYVNCFNDISCVSSLKVLEEHPGPAKLVEVDQDKLAELRYGENNHRLGEEKAATLKEAAETTVGKVPSEDTEFTLKFMAKRLNPLTQEVKQLKERIEARYQEVDPNELASVDGIGEFSAAIITTEIMDIDRFPTATKLNGYVGAYPELKSSGKSSDPKPEMTEKGNSYLRHAIFMCTLSAVVDNRVIKNHYQKQLKRGKEEMVAIGSCMRKMVHLIYGILKSGEPFDPHYEEKRGRANKEEEKPEPQTGSDPANERSPDFSQQNVGKVGVGSQGYEEYP
ncbi:MAG: IS110 family transposase [Candidatus Bipolaricaulia bacterium]